MRWRALLVLLAALAGCVARPPAALRPVYREIPIGLCEDYPEESTSWERVRADFAVLRAAGIADLRISLGWDSIEPRDDAFEWAFWDEFMRIAVEEYGLRLRPYVAYTPAWAAADGDGAIWARPPREMAEFAEFVRAVVDRYGAHVASWEIWNEPDNPAYWTGSAAQFATLLDAGAAAVREADPDAIVVLGGIAWNVDFVATLFEDHTAAAAVDVVNVHSYAETWSNDPLESVAPYVAQVADVIARAGDGEPIWVAEVGYGSYRAGARVSHDYTARYAYEHTADYQAVALVRMVTRLLATGAVSLIAWYEIRDLPAGADVIGDENNRHLGVLTVDGAPKPALAALTFMRALFRLPVRVAGGAFGVTRPAGSTSVVHAFERRDGRWIVVAWLPTHEPERDAAQRDGLALDRREETISVALPADVRTVTLHDELGRVRATRPAAPYFPLLLRGGEVVIAVAR